MKVVMAITFLGLSACAMIERSPRSGYMTEYESTASANDIYVERRMNVENQAREELGLLGRPLTDPERQALEDRIRLKRLEGKLTTRRDKQQYYGVRSSMRNDRERIYFLSLPTYEARERWADSRGFRAETGHNEETARIIEAKDIALGMTQKAVMESWGDPDAVEIAGNPIYGFERWKYNRFVSGQEGYQKEMRIVYFEGGRVVGWEKL